MNFLFENAPWVVPGTDKEKYKRGLLEELDRRAREIEEKGGVLDRDGDEAGHHEHVAGDSKEV